MSLKERYDSRKPPNLKKVYKRLAEPLSDEDDECDVSEEDALSDKADEQEDTMDTDEGIISSNEENLIMSQGQFCFLLRYKRFVDKETRKKRKQLDKLALIRKVFGKFVDNCQKAYTTPEHVTTDEKLESFRGNIYHSGNSNKPEIATFYNCTKGGVNVSDKLCATYNTSRNSRRWPMTIFYSLLSTAGINANIIHTANNNRGRMRSMFFRELVFGLVDEHHHSRADISNL
ncbi:hypothetical protein PR048_032177 [Dryococelus australis]|uniref:PiggyBac transposable element-derived protein domain-containing protein n=1 Tax=Dryococelus australis TaxID=614101 RepID=A0ABQ9G1G1_9NEOP|nr:hypothetical protein PR048_032177 [Dryococelus australis]